MTENEIEIIKERLLDEFNRYRINLEIILALRFLIKSNNLKIKICPPERKVIVTDSSPKKSPDLIIHDSTQNFVLNEIKTSITSSSENITQILDYLDIDSILDDSGVSIIPNDYSLNLIVNMESYDNIRNDLLNPIDNKLQDGFSITIFIRSESVPRRGMIYYLFELRDNATILDEYNALLSSRKKVYHVDIQIEGEQLYFTNDPPIQYTIIILWTLIIPTIVRNEENQEFSFEESERVITNIFVDGMKIKSFLEKNG